MLASLFVFVAIFINAQERELIDGVGFPSYYSQIKEGTFKGHVCGILKITTIKRDSVIVNFNSDAALLSIVKDPDEVYDISFKKYQTVSDDGKVKLEYTTYAFANALQIQLNGKIYQLGGIDGACDLVINGLNYEYTGNMTSEFLLLRFSKNIGLRELKSGRAISLFVKKGSMLMFFNSN